MTRLLAFCLGLLLLFAALTTAIVLGQRRSFPNAASLVFSMGHDSYNLYAVQPDSGFGSNFHTLFMPNHVFDDRYVTGVDCAPDSRSLIFWYIYLYRLDLTDERLTQIVLGQGLSQQSVWSPDGTRIAYIDNVLDRQPREILLIDADGSNRVQITHNDNQETSLTWSPDGQQIAYTYTRGSQQGLGVVDVNSRQTTPLFEAVARIGDASWSPDGRQIAFDMLQNGQTAIYTIGLDGAPLQRLTRDSGEQIVPRWSPDGSLISYSSRAPGEHFKLYVMDADGSHPYMVFPTIENEDVFNQCWLNLS
ncbi:MAG: hypothetical protein GC204_07095 [Chloroflexi bacterium]|nr:hypothetical protein [Chloroflexota bacterium]